MVERTFPGLIQGEHPICLSWCRDVLANLRLRPRLRLGLGGGAAAVHKTPVDIDEETAAALGFPKPQYRSVERERRWLCEDVPRDRIVSSQAITDLYVSGARLRLRAARPLDGGAPLLRLTRKADVDSRTRLITSIYLPQDEFEMLARVLTGSRIEKVRHRLQPVAGSAHMSVDAFQGALAGLVLAEAEFDTPESLARFPMPDFAVREVTDDPRYTGVFLAKNGLPSGT